ncbi:MAG: S-methyl-5'-thioadenosine phosphorylase [Candidatus Nanoarchaeia archaeon]
MKKAEICVIGGTGAYSEDFLEKPKKIDVKTPYGKPSSKIVVGNYKGRQVAFLFRHGEKHTIPPHKVNYLANIFALKKLGVERIIATAAVGSLREEMKPGDIVLPDQFIDMTKQRKLTFYDGPKVAHVSLADPFCSEMRNTAIDVINNLQFPLHTKGTYVCIEGPRFSTRAESHFFRMIKADIIGMTLVPEVILAREQEICYLTLATVTDYDCWREGEAVSAEEVVKIMRQNTDKVKKIIEKLLLKIPKERDCICKKALASAGL